MGAFRYILVCIALCLLPQAAISGGILDGRSFSGLIGPAEAPDLKDSLHFAEGHFWSEICARCGFVPGPYEAEITKEGIVFRGILQSPDHGKFTYRGTIEASGAIWVDIAWERRRWYWTARRQIVFRGHSLEAAAPSGVATIRDQIEALDPNADPACARL